jgi:hypothetical protein
MTSPFKDAELVGGPLDGLVYDRRSDRFPKRLQMSVNGYVELYVARFSRLGNVIYRYAGRMSVEAVK